MALELADYIDELIATNPTVADPVAQGDDHLRLIKQVLQNALPGNTAPLTFTGDMNLTGDYNGANATMTGTVAGTSVTDGVYTLAQAGFKAVALDAYGVITSNTTFDGFGVSAVSQPSSGEWIVTFNTDVIGTDKQAVFYSFDNPSPGTGAFSVAVGTHLNSTQVKVYGRLQAGPTTAVTSGFPIDVVRLVFL